MSGGNNSSVGLPPPATFLLRDEYPKLSPTNSSATSLHRRCSFRGIIRNHQAPYIPSSRVSLRHIQACSTLPFPSQQFSTPTPTNPPGSFSATPTRSASRQRFTGPQPLPAVTAVTYTGTLGNGDKEWIHASGAATIRSE